RRRLPDDQPEDHHRAGPDEDEQHGPDELGDDLLTDPLHASSLRRVASHGPETVGRLQPTGAAPRCREEGPAPSGRIRADMKVLLVSADPRVRETMALSAGSVRRTR